MKELTGKQRQILDFILSSIAEDGRFPSYREIGARFGLNSVATVAQHLAALEEKEFLRRDGRKLMPVPGLRREQGIPILGQVAAGAPITAVQNWDGQLGWDLFGREPSFAVRVRGDSMIEDGIYEDDFVIVEPGTTARNGELVVALVGEDHEATVKRFYRLKDRIELRPANWRYTPIRIALRDSNFSLAGRVVGVVRKV